MRLTINGKEFELDVPPETPLLWVLREECQLTGTKFGCGKGLCGACTVHLNGAAIRSCVTPASAAVGSSVTTIEGLSQGDTLHAVQKAWVELDVVQCGYCQPGQIMAATALLKQNKKPDDSAIATALTGNLCRCGTYPRIKAAVQRASQLLQKGGPV